MPETVLSTCRACGAPHPYLFLPLGAQPPANMFVRPDELSRPQPVFELNGQVCLHCGLIQVADQIPADFFRDYLYVPSGATTMHTHFGSFAERIVARAGGGLVVDIGCNDGLLLSAVNRCGGRSLGVDPAQNLAAIAAERGVRVHVDYFGPAVADTVRALHGDAQVIVTTNTFNHIGDLHAFVEGVSRLLSRTGTFIIEVPWSKDLVERNEFDTIYHEHVSEFSLRSIVELGAFFDFAVVDVEKLPVHGGSMRVFLQRAGTAQPATARVAAMLGEEGAAGLFDRATYDAFAARVTGIGERLRAMIAELRASGRKVAGYGAPAKGNTLLNTFGIGPDALDFLVDRNPLKQNLHSPGMKIPIRSTDAIADERPDVLLVLAWNFFDEIREQQQAFVAAGGRFLVPLPEPVLVQ